MAPEVLNRQNHSYAVDYYALGVITYECMMGKRPYTGKSRAEIKEQVMAKQATVKLQDIPFGWD
jgi:serine/threonine protein kinase